MLVVLFINDTIDFSIAKKNGGGFSCKKKERKKKMVSFLPKKKIKVLFIYCFAASNRYAVNKLNKEFTIKGVQMCFPLIILLLLIDKSTKKKKKPT